MSELDFEEEVTEEPLGSLQKESVIDIEHEIIMNDERFSCVEELNEDTSQINFKTVVNEEMSDGEIKSDSGELSDLEEGEINDPISHVNNNMVCRFFLRGTCTHGSHCRFMHVGDSAYKMFEKISTKRVVHFVNTREPSFCYPPKPEFPDSNSAPRENDNWDRALQEAKAMMLNAKDRKKTDVEFDKKKLYANCEENKVEKDAFYNSNGKAQLVECKNKHRHNYFTFKSDEHCYGEKENKLIKRNSHSKNTAHSQNWVDPWRRSRSRTRRSVSRSSFSSDQHSSSVSSSSTRSLSRSPEKKFHRKKQKSKLNRMHSRTLSRSCSRKRSRSRSLPYSSRSRSCSRGKFSSFSSSRSRSRSSSASSFSKIYSSEYLPPKSALNTSARKKSPSHQLKKRKPNSPLQEIKAPTTNLALEIDSSDITVSCISCTSLSCSDVSSVSDNDSVKQNKRKNISSSANQRDMKLSNGGGHLKETQNNDGSRTNTSFKNDENVHASKEKRFNDDYSSRICNRPVDERAYSKQSDEYYSDYKHHKKYSHEKLRVEKVTEELPKYHKPNELNSQMVNVACSKAHVLSPKSKSSDRQEYFAKKSINLNLKSKSSVSDKSHNASIESPIKLKQPLSRRERLLKQLKAIEVAIAKKKQN